MTKIFTISAILFLYFANDKSYSQSANWGNWGTMQCYKGLQAASKNYGYVKTVNQYSWQAKIKSNYNKKVTFNMTWTVGGESISIGQVTLNPGQEYSHTSRYFNSNANLLYIGVEDVCFANNWVSCKGCFANCDNGSPNQPDCNNSPTSSQQTTNNSNQNSTYQIQQQNNSSIQQQSQTNNSGQNTTQPNDLTDYYRSKADIERQMQEQNQKNAIAQERQRQQEAQQQELKRQEDAKRTAAYIDLGVQTIKGVSGLISSLRAEKQAKRDLEWEKRDAENHVKGEKIFKKIDLLDAEYTKDSDVKKIEQIADLYDELGDKSYLYYEKDNQKLYKEHAIKLYNKSLSLGNYSFRTVEKYLGHFADKEYYKDDALRKKNYTLLFNHITDQFEKYKDEGNGEKCFNFAKIYAMSYLMFKKGDNLTNYDFKTFLEHKKQEKYWLDKAVALNFPQAIAVAGNYYRVGDFFFERNIEKAYSYYRKSLSLGFDNVIGLNDSLIVNLTDEDILKISKGYPDLVNLNNDEILKWEELFILNDHKKIRKYLIELSTHHGLRFKEYDRNKYYSSGNGFTIRTDKNNSGTPIFELSNFDFLKIFGNSKFSIRPQDNFKEFAYGDLLFSGDSYSKIRGYTQYVVVFNDELDFKLSSNEIKKIMEEYLNNPNTQK